MISLYHSTFKMAGPKIPEWNPDQKQLTLTDLEKCALRQAVENCSPSNLGLILKYATEKTGWRFGKVLKVFCDRISLEMLKVKKDSTMEEIKDEGEDMDETVFQEIVYQFALLEGARLFQRGQDNKIIRDCFHTIRQHKNTLMGLIMRTGTKED